MTSIIGKIQDFFTKGHERSLRAKRNVVQMLLCKSTSLFLSLLFVPLFLNCMDTVRYGIWVTVFTLVSFIGFFDVGIGQGLRNKLAEAMAKNDIKEAREYTSTAYFTIIIIFLTLDLLFLVLSNFINWSILINPPKQLIEETHILIVIIISIMFINLSIRLFNSVLYAMQMPAITAISELISQFICLIFVYFTSRMAFIHHIYIFGLIMTIIPTIILIGFSIYFFKGKFKDISPSYIYFNKNKIKDIMMLGGNFFIIQIAFIMLTQSNNIIIANVVGPDAVPGYYVVFRYLSIIFMIFTIITTPLWSATTEAYNKNDIKWIRVTTKKLLNLLGVFILVGVIMILFSDFAFKIWLNNRIPINILLMVLTFIYLIIQMIWSIYGSVINGIGKVRIQLIVTVIGVVIHIPLAIFLGRMLGAVGVILSLVIVSSSYLLWAPYQYKKLLNGTATGIWNK